jgi:Ser/Thr protein kinase RdoA (MazF antagonist)
MKSEDSSIATRLWERAGLSPSGPTADGAYRVADQRYQLLDLAQEEGALDYVLGICEGLRKAGWAVPALVARLQGAALLGPLPSGDSAEGDPAGIGRALALFHQAAEGFERHREDPRDARWLRESAEAVVPELGSEEAEALRGELRFQGLYRFADLPRGTCHGDPVSHPICTAEGCRLPQAPALACTGPWLLDIALAGDAHCAPQGVPDLKALQMLLTGYAEVRPLTAIERGAWPVLLRAAALRRWIEARLAGDEAEAAWARTRAQSYAAAETDLHRRWVARH